MIKERIFASVKMNQYNILIIDNNPVFAKSLQNLISEVTGSIKTNIQCAYNDIDCRDLFREQTFHFIFWDVDMIDFQETWNYFNELKTHTQSKVTGITFHPEQKDWYKKKYKGISKYLTKDTIEPQNIHKIIFETTNI
jgi:response regulator RpfG family c-di-GMP phosphodiesterase